MTSSNLSSLPRFPLSAILSYLQQPSPQNGTSNDTSTSPPLPHNRDALSFLLATKRLAYAIMPLFRVPKHICRNYQCRREDGTLIAVVEKYRFIALPIQDPCTLLDRLNTRRLRGRIGMVNRLKREETGLEICKEGEADSGIEIKYNQSDNTGNGTNSQPIMVHGSCYQHGRTIEELAFEEWTIMEIDHADCNNKNDKSNQWRTWPAHLELLRFLENGRSGELQNRNSHKQTRSIPSPFCFRSSSTKQLDGVPHANNNSIGGQVFGNEISLLASYPRSGNTLLRTLLERITSIVTGSDTRPDRNLSKSLAMEHDLVGEGLVGAAATNNHRSKTKTKTKARSSVHLQNLYQSAQDPNVHIVKTHFPERKGWKPVTGNRVLLLVRNPYDAIDSYWNLCCTNTHTRSLDESVYAEYAKKFEGLSRHEIEIWCEFHYHWIDICEKEGVPLLVVRYEDLVLDTEAEMLRIMKFLMGDTENDEFASFWEWRIHQAIGKTAKKANTAKEVVANEKKESSTTNTSNLGSYRPRSSSGGLLSIGKSIRKKRYSESVLWHMHDIAVSLELARKQQNSNNPFSSTKSEKQQQQQPNKTLLQQFGYDIFTQQFPENFKDSKVIASCRSGKRKGTVVINKTPEIRKKDDPFGRPMTFWRRGETDGDTKPFPTIPR